LDREENVQAKITGVFMAFLSAFLFILIAGVINGSFALPTKYIVKWKFENIWLQYALWAFVILPWLIMFIMVPQVFSIYSATSEHLLWIIFWGGLVFGAGQICFALALNMIGLGLGFVINLGLGISLGFLLPLVFQHPQQIKTPFGIITLVGTALAVVGLIISNRAGRLRDREKKSIALELYGDEQKSNHTLGVVLAAIAGLASAGQNFAFSLTYAMQTTASHLGASALGAANIIWPGFLVCGFIPYAAYTLYLHGKNRSFYNYRKTGTGKYHLFAVIMGLCWYGSLIFYSKASQIIGVLGPLVGWPIFMVLIILVSSFWGWKHKEWEGCSKKAKNVMKLGLLFLVAAIVVLGCSSLGG
jgi:L-rhamnose-H+ transport protein